MSLCKLVTCLALLSSGALAQYYLIEDYMANGQFFDQFTFFTGTDPTNGFVQYQSRSAAQSQGLISSSANNVYMGVDNTHVQPHGRPSVRITSNRAYNSGLFILDLEHMPGGICGTWPAFWTVGPNWPNNGEIDIIEGVHQQTVNDMTMHSNNNCVLAHTGAFAGNAISSNCYVNAAGQPANQGCSTQGTNTNTYGTGFNAVGGGIYAMEWVNVAISIWHWPRGQIPADITNGHPNPAGWGKPLAQLYGPDGCNIPSHFAKQQIVFDTTFCGDWAGSVWGSSSCASKASSCNSYVANNPSAFRNAYWSVNSLKVYQINGQASNMREFTAKTPANMSFTELHQAPHDNVPAGVPENYLRPLSPHGKV